MTNYSRTTLRELKKRYLNVLKKCLLANLLAFSFVLPSMAEETWNEIELTTQIKTQADVDALNLGSGNTKIKYTELHSPSKVTIEPKESVLFNAQGKSITLENTNPTGWPGLMSLSNAIVEFSNIKDLTLNGVAMSYINNGSKLIINIDGEYKVQNGYQQHWDIDALSEGYLFAKSIDIETKNNVFGVSNFLHLRADDIRLVNVSTGGTGLFSRGGKIFLQGKNLYLKGGTTAITGGGSVLIGGIHSKEGNEIITPFETIIIDTQVNPSAKTSLFKMYSDKVEINDTIFVDEGGKLQIETTTNLTVNANIVFRDWDGIDNGSKVFFNSHNGKMLLNGDIQTVNQISGAKGELLLISDKGGIMEIMGRILNHKDGETSTASETPENLKSGVFITLDESTLKLHKDSEIEEISSNKGVIDLTNTTSESAIQIASLEGEETTIQVANSDTAKTTIGNNKSKKLSVKATSKMNDEMNNPNALATSLASLVEVESGNQEVKLEAEEGKLAGRFEGVVLNGNVTKLRASQNTVTESVKDVMGLQVLSFRNQINDVQKRMGDLRLDENTKGTWVRTFGGDVKFGDMGLKNKYNTIQVGADFKKGNAYFGIMASLTEGESDMDRGTGEDKTYGMGVYAGYMTDNGWYVDATAKQMHLQNKFKAKYNTGELSRGSYKTWGTSVSLEAGKRMNLPCGFFVEPQAEIMYGRVQGIDYTTSAGVKVEQEAFESLIGRAGLSVGKTFKDKGSVYANVSVLNDFAGKVKTSFSYWNQETKTRDDMGGAWTEFAVGGTYKLNKNTAVYGEFATSKGTDLTNPIQWSLGLRFSF